ncbi:transmembrane protein 81 [Hippocampus comes]|uniref:transmembrane protein 81 n=1 Tax=Hippocampus comes TaxID=109280 RepID=UPI00094E544B|nr:PREDICTED: transmembrane protein 81 [Hippocampus comes]
MDRMPVLLLAILHLHLSCANVEKVQLQVVVNSTLCSVTCGMGIKVHTVCTMKDGEKAVEKTKGSAEAVEAMEQCHDVKVKCRESWQCGLKTVTVTTGEKLKLDCLVEDTKKMEHSWRVTWHRATGVISSDDLLFARWDNPQLDLVILNPVREEHAGTYRCDVLDANFRRLKTVYWGVRVLPKGILNLDYDHAQSVWDSPWNWKKYIMSRILDSPILWLYIMMTFLSLLNVGAVLFLAVRILKKRGSFKITEDANCPETMTEL